MENLSKQQLDEMLKREGLVLSQKELDRLALEGSAINLPEMAFNVTSVTLVQSILLPSGAEYRALGQIPFMQPLSKIEFQ